MLDIFKVGLYSHLATYMRNVNVGKNRRDL